MINIFKYFSKKRREQRKKLKQLSTISSVFSTISKLETAEQLIWNEKDRRLFITQSLASLMLAQGPEAWTAFVQNVYLYHYYQQCQAMWDAYVQAEELSAVRKAYQSATPPLTSGDTDRIRLAARQRILDSDCEPPKVQPFEFFIIRTTANARPDLIAVGYFDPETDDQEIAPWSEVSPLLKANDKKSESD